VEVSTIVHVDAISPEEVSRLGNVLLAAVGGRGDRGEQLHVELVHDEERATLRIIVLGAVAATAEGLSILDTLLREHR